jgi:hypothetical protein
MDMKPVYEAWDTTDYASRLLKQASGMGYCAEFKSLIENAARQLEYAAETLRNMQNGS